MRTKRTHAVADTADAASVRICGTFLVAAQHKSPKPPFDGAELAQTETVNSPQLDLTTQTPKRRALVSRTSLAQQIYRMSLLKC